MRTLYMFLFVAAFFAVEVVGFAQQQPTLVWERSFGFGDQGVPCGLQNLPNDGIFVNGWSETSALTRATLAGFASDGTSQWLTQDTMFAGHSKSFSGHLATLTADNAVVWFEGARGSYEPSWVVKLGMNGTEQWRIPVNRLMFLGNHTDTTFVAVLTGNLAIGYVYSRNGAILQQFPLGTAAEAIVNPVGINNHLWVGGHFYAGVVSSVSYFIAKYDLSTGAQVWRREFTDVTKGFVTVDQETGESYVFGTKIVNEPMGVLKFVRAKVSVDGGLLWQREWFGRDSLATNYNNWADAVSLVGNGTSKQVVCGGAIQRGNSPSSSSTDAYAVGVNPTNGDILWTETRGDGLFCAFLGAISTTGNAFVLLEQVWSNNNGSGKLLKFLAPTLSVQELPGLPESFSLSQNYPNPFNPSTTIRFELLSRTPVRLTVHDVLGREVATLVNETLESGVYETVWDATGMASGTYFYRLTSNGLVQTKRMVLLK